MIQPNNPTEQIEILNEFGEKTGEILDRKIVHIEGKWHGSSHIHIINSNKETLLQLRSKQKKIYPRVWAPSVGGHIDAHSNALQTAIREANEELGIDITPEDLQYIGTVKDMADFGELLEREFVNVFILQEPHDLNMKMTNDEVEELKWFSQVELLDLSQRKDPKLLPAYNVWNMLLGYLKTQE